MRAANAPRVALVLASALAFAGCGSPAIEVTTFAEDAAAVATFDAAPGSPPDATPSPDAAPLPPDAGPDAQLVDAAPAEIDATADAGPPDSDGDGVSDPSDCAPNDPARWQLLPYSFVDGDGDTYTIVQSGTVCAGATLPAGYASFGNGNDCDDTNPSAFTLASVFADADGDGVGAGTPSTMCIGANAPTGDALTGTDCAPSDSTAWQELPFTYRDADGDGYTVGLSGQVCAGLTLPVGYSSQSNGDDCDDTNPAIYDALTVYADTDGDGVGAGSGTLVCTNGSTPAGDTLTDSDCASTDPTKWQTLTYGFVDRDGDGITAPETGTLCAGAALLPPYYATAHGNDCDDSSPALTQWEIVYPDKDGDGAGGLPLQILCEGPVFTLPAGYSRYGDDEDDTKASVGPLPPEDILDLVLD